MPLSGAGFGSPGVVVVSGVVSGVGVVSAGLAGSGAVVVSVLAGSGAVVVSGVDVVSGVIVVSGVDVVSGVIVVSGVVLKVVSLSVEVVSSVDDPPGLSASSVASFIHVLLTFTYSPRSFVTHLMILSIVSVVTFIYSQSSL